MVYAAPMSVRRAAFEALRKLGPAAAFALCAALLGSTPGCTEPHFETDAGHDAGEIEAGQSPTQAQPDAAPEAPGCEHGSCGVGFPGGATNPGGGPPLDAAGLDPDAQEPIAAPDGGLDPIRGMWVGHFATRSFLFSYDSPLKTTAHLLTLADIKSTPNGGLVLEEKPCRYDGSWSFFVMGALRVDFPEMLLSSPVTFDDTHFSSAVSVGTVGYDKPPAACTAGASTTSASAAQTWLTDACDCPVPNDSTPPTTAHDCRLTDPDGDGKPGDTYSVLVETSMLVYHVAQLVRLRFLNGYRLNDRLYADREFIDTTNVIDCVIDGSQTRSADCPSGNAKACPTQYNKAEFVRVPANYGCDEIVEREQALFTVSSLEYPGACPSAVSSAP